MFSQLLKTQYGLHVNSMKKSGVGAGSDTWFVYCDEGDFVLKYPAVSEINHPEQEPELCEFLNKHGIPVCSFLQNRSGSYLSDNLQGREFTVQTDAEELQRYIQAYCRYGTPNEYDIENLCFLFLLSNCGL